MALLGVAVRLLLGGVGVALGLLGVAGVLAFGVLAVGAGGRVAVALGGVFTGAVVLLRGVLAALVALGRVAGGVSGGRVLAGAVVLGGVLPGVVGGGVPGVLALLGVAVAVVPLVVLRLLLFVVLRLLGNGAVLVVVGVLLGDTGLLGAGGGLLVVALRGVSGGAGLGVGRGGVGVLRVGVVGAGVRGRVLRFRDRLAYSASGAGGASVSARVAASASAAARRRRARRPSPSRSAKPAVAAAASSGRSSSALSRRPGRAMTTATTARNAWRTSQPMWVSGASKVTSSRPPEDGRSKPWAQPSTTVGASGEPSSVAFQPGAEASASRRTRPAGPAGTVVCASTRPEVTGTARAAAPVVFFGGVIVMRETSSPLTCQTSEPPVLLSRLRPGVVSRTRFMSCGAPGSSST